MVENKNILVLGAGISGLATAFWLQKNGFNITILESKNEPGGSMLTIQENGFIVDFGPNSGLETTPLIKKLVDAVGLTDEMIYADKAGNKRYILKNNELYALPTGAGAFFKTKLFSTKAKLRLLAEPFIGKSDDGYYQSISDFVIRRLGQEFLDYAINPFVAGVFAGNPDKLSVKSAFPKLYRLEEVYGGLIKGMIKGAKERKRNAEKSKQNAAMFSFKYGMQSFTKAIASKIENIKYNAEVQSIKKENENYVVSYIQDNELKKLSSPLILSTMPAYKTAKAFSGLDEGLISHLNAVYYPPVKVLYLGYKKSQIERPLDGFGFLIPEKEKKKFLGAIWSSVIFPNRAPEHTASFTLFIGGARSPELFNDDRNNLTAEVLNEFTSLMKINGKPVFIKEKMWHKAIPQYNIGYIEHENYFDKFEKENPGIFLSGNYRGGISVGDCIKNSGIIAEKIVNSIDV